MSYVFDGDFSNVVTLKELKKQVLINAICITKTMKEACLEADVSTKTLIDFCGKYNIDSEARKLMRAKFKAQNIKIKLRDGTSSKKIRHTEVNSSSPRYGTRP